ncbi:YihY/virulence factor BrkB family protein [Microbacterium horticulturae]|uniref:YihY/virulence factor BrkB family protein n=1 Tax=Microbacterium horticulturae TaxID=3028316 RepID=A0ABY8BUU9_9MICO|nr:YihY/virulence factor BrkB family protein [Microbacterium sp. KACC 23027]WEG07960.1 YihY/virulence factor BrkB family protein [Microbacterium sp. KACC 23027]
MGQTRARATAADARARASRDPDTPDDETLHERWDAAATSLRERFDEPINRATALTRRTLAWFPIRVWRHFLRSNGFLLAASISYQSLFAIFAVVYASFAGIGIWLGNSTPAVNRMIQVINSYIPNLISDEDGALIAPESVQQVTSQASGVLAITGAIALGVAIWTAIGFVTFTRRAVRDIFGLPFDTRNYIYLKARDFLAGAMFGIALIIGAIVGWIASGALDTLLSLIGLDGSTWSQVAVKLLSGIVGFVLTSAALAGLFRFLTGTSLPWRRIWPGALLGGAAIAVLQLGVGLLFTYTPSNPLLTTFSVMIALLLWFRLIGIVILVAASWIAVSATDREIPLAQPSEAERALAEHEALLLAAHVRLRDTRVTRAAAPWWRRWRATREVHDAEEQLAEVEASAPPEAR